MAPTIIINKFGHYCWGIWKTQRDAFHSTKISENSVSKSNGTESFRKFLVNLPGLSFSNSRNFLFHLAFLPGMNRPSFPSREFCLGQSYKIVAKRSATVRACSRLPIFHKNFRIWFSGKLWTGRSKFPVGIRPFCIISHKKSLQASLITRKWCLSWSGKYQGQVSLLKITCE